MAEDTNVSLPQLAADLYNPDLSSLSVSVAGLVSFLRLCNIYFLPVIVLIGVLGNVLTVLVFRLSHLRHLSSSSYLVALALSDSGFLLCMGISWLDVVKFRLFHQEGFCQVGVFLTYVFGFLSVWIVVAFTTELYLSMFHPKQRVKASSPRRAQAVVCGLMAVAVVLYLYTLWTSKPTLVNDVLVCQGLRNKADAMFALSMLDSVLTLILPYSALIFMHVRILREIIHVYRSSSLSPPRADPEPLLGLEEIPVPHDNGLRGGELLDPARLLETGARGQEAHPVDGSSVCLLGAAAPAPASEAGAELSGWQRTSASAPLCGNSAEGIRAAPADMGQCESARTGSGCLSVSAAALLTAAGPGGRRTSALEQGWERAMPGGPGARADDVMRASSFSFPHPGLGLVLRRHDSAPATTLVRPDSSLVPNTSRSCTLGSEDLNRLLSRMRGKSRPDGLGEENVTKEAPGQRGRGCRGHCNSLAVLEDDEEAAGGCSPPETQEDLTADQTGQGQDERSHNSARSQQGARLPSGQRRQADDASQVHVGPPARPMDGATDETACTVVASCANHGYPLNTDLLSRDHLDGCVVPSSKHEGVGALEKSSGCDSSLSEPSHKQGPSANFLPVFSPYLHRHGNSSSTSGASPLASIAASGPLQLSSVTAPRSPDDVRAPGAHAHSRFRPLPWEGAAAASFGPAASLGPKEQDVDPELCGKTLPAGRTPTPQGSSSTMVARRLPSSSLPADSDAGSLLAAKHPAQREPVSRSTEGCDAVQSVSSVADGLLGPASQPRAQADALPVQVNGFPSLAHELRRELMAVQETSAPPSGGGSLSQTRPEPRESSAAHFLSSLAPQVSPDAPAAPSPSHAFSTPQVDPSGPAVPDGHPDRRSTAAIFSRRISPSSTGNATPPARPLLRPRRVHGSRIPILVTSASSLSSDTFSSQSEARLHARASRLALGCPREAGQGQSSFSSLPLGRGALQQRHLSGGTVGDVDRNSSSYGSTVQRQTAMMLFIVVVVFLLLNLPIHLIRLQALIRHRLQPGYATSLAEHLCQQLFQILYFINFAANFIIYSAYSVSFRATLVRLPLLLRDRLASCARRRHSTQESGERGQGRGHGREDTRLVDIHLSEIHLSKIRSFNSSFACPSPPFLLGQEGTVDRDI